MRFALVILLFGFGAFAKPLRIAIDPGHGGSDQGAVRGKVKEADIVLKVSQALKSILETDNRFESALTRTSDSTIPLQERVHRAERIRADVFLSIHANASVDKRARGVEFYFQNHLPPDEETLYLAASENQVANRTAASAEEENSRMEPSKKNDVLSILEDLKRHYRMRSSHLLSKMLLENWDQGSKNDSNIIRQAPFFVVTKSPMPSVLVELGFISNPKEADRLVNPAYQKEIAERIYRGLVKYKEFVDKTSAINLN